MQLGLQTPISKTKPNREHLKSVRGSLSLVRTSSFLSHFKDWSMRAQLARVRQEVAVQLSESPPPPFFLLAPTLHLVGIVKPWKQPTVAQEKYFLQFLKCLPEELQTAGDDIMLADKSPLGQWSHSNGCHPRGSASRDFLGAQSPEVHNRGWGQPLSEGSTICPQTFHSSAFSSDTSKLLPSERRGPAGQN